jgi:geranylgeranyl pyrophosphate synthase
VRNLIEATGAAQVVEDMIHERHRHALSALHALDIPTQVRDQLRDLADQAAWRSA